MCTYVCVQSCMYINCVYIVCLYVPYMHMYVCKMCTVNTVCMYMCVCMFYVLCLQIRVKCVPMVCSTVHICIVHTYAHMCIRMCNFRC